MIRARGVMVWPIVSLLAMASVAGAVGPELPLRFDADPVGKETWVLPLIVDAELVSDLSLERRLYKGGVLVDRDRLEVELEPSPQYQRADRKIMEARLPLRFDDMKGLEPGLYAQKLVVEGRWSELPDSRPIHIERWSRFQVDKEGVRLLGLEEYSALADPAEVALDSEGRKVLVQVGIASKDEVPLPETKASPAVPLGRFGGLVEERPEDYRPMDDEQREDKSEIDED